MTEKILTSAELDELIARHDPSLEWDGIEINADVHPDDFEDWEAEERQALYYDQCFGGGKPAELD